ncbi:hypothetical protein [Cellulomonas xiejunii]|uniref:hypothetical protein n=1 Tax=Cellulomonas xiejunii TaxID=2968083 RepID=UPI001D0E332F|nr:hypothetical protein [Cellulomonas xiejunii]MCC2315314.1 hypothetical protein [Cellulomonas xiejunii]
MKLPGAGWAGWTPGASIRTVAERLGEDLAIGDEARRAVRASIESINSDSRRKGDFILQNAVWVPDPSTGAVAAVLDATVRSTPGGSSAPARYLARNIRRDFGWTTRIVEYVASESRVPAGRMTAEHTIVRPFGERQVQGYLFLRVFPPGAGEAFSLLLNTVHLDLLTELARQGRMMAESLQLTLGHIPGGRPPA